MRKKTVALSHEHHHLLTSLSFRLSLDCQRRITVVDLVSMIICIVLKNPQILKQIFDSLQVDLQNPNDYIEEILEQVTQNEVCHDQQ